VGFEKGYVEYITSSNAEVSNPMAGISSGRTYARRPPASGTYIPKPHTDVVADAKKRKELYDRGGIDIEEFAALDQGFPGPPTAAQPNPLNSTSDCSKPDCRTCRRLREEEYKKLPKFYTGCRVTVHGIGPLKRVGTVINLTGKNPSKSVAVCLDSPVGPDVQALSLEELTKPGYGVLVDEKDVRILKDQSSYEAFAGMPAHVGVMITENRRVDLVGFKSGQTGRLLAQPAGAGGRVLVSFNFANKHFFSPSQNQESYGRSECIDEIAGNRCYNVPRSLLAFCRMGEGSERPVIIWPNSSDGPELDFKKGDYVRILAPELLKINDGQRSYRLSLGTLAQFRGPIDRHKSHVTLAGGCDPAILGLEAVVATKGLEKIKEEFIEGGVEVVISATLDFRRRDLKGLKAIVILPMDQDGEIGLQFEEDIGAGSLDGHGEDKRCLYIHHSSVKRASG